MFFEVYSALAEHKINGLLLKWDEWGCITSLKLVSSSLAPVLLPVVGGAANKWVSLAAEELLAKSKKHLFHVFHLWQQFHYIFKAFLLLPSPTPFPPFLPHVRSPVDPSGGCPSPSWWIGWDGVQQPLPVPRLFCRYFCAVWLRQWTSSVFFTTDLASWLSCNLQTHIFFKPLKIILVRGVCSDSSWSWQQGLGVGVRSRIRMPLP